MWRILQIGTLGLVIGLGSAMGAIWAVGRQGAIAIGPWHTPLDAGGAGRNMYLRAAVALGATLGLSRTETLYFRATTDSAGDALGARCTYRVAGPDLAARWWSLTLYGADHYLIANASHRYSVNSVALTRRTDGGFAVRVGPGASGDDAIDSGAAEHIVLLLRLYQPSPEVARLPGALILPRIDRVGCA